MYLCVHLLYMDVHACTYMYTCKFFYNYTFIEIYIDNYGCGSRSCVLQETQADNSECEYVYLYVCMCILIRVCIRVFTCMYTYTYVCELNYLYIRMYACTYVFKLTYIYICMYTLTVQDQDHGVAERQGAHRDYLTRF